MKLITFMIMITISNALVNKSPVPDIKKRQLMNSILLNSVYTSCGPLLFGYLNFFYPIQSSNNEGGILCKDREGNDVLLNSWLKDNPPPSRNLVQGINGDPYYLISTSDTSIEKYGLNAICTHLGCVVPWNKAENKFMCPCHGSQYNEQGKVIRGPAPKSLALSNIEISENKVYMKPWVDEDFRTNESPWWI